MTDKPYSGRTRTEIDFDIFVIGGGINGCGIARDSAGRGVRVALAEMNDLASATSSASTKLLHGGLRYLEFFKFRLVREALIEREVLLKNMPHISWPLRFILPYHTDIRFAGNTPLSKILSKILPWMKGRRPGWLISMGLFIYDHLGGRNILPPATTLDLTIDPAGEFLDNKFIKAFEYSDCWVEDSRLVVLNARDARQRGAHIMTRTKVISVERHKHGWSVQTENVDDGTRQTYVAKAIVNAGGPWVESIINNIANINSQDGIRLVRGSHIVTRKVYDHDRCYVFQGTDGRISFAIPYEGDFTLFGTTDVDHDSLDKTPVCSPKEQAYLIDFANRFLKVPLRDKDVVWSFAGVRPLYDDGASSATAATRDYVLRVHSSENFPLLSVYGGKITTYRKLAESVISELTPFLPALNGKKGNWTIAAPLPGGGFGVGEFEDLCTSIQKKYKFLLPPHIRRLARTYGTEVFDMLGKITSPEELGVNFGADIFEIEVVWSIRHEWVCSAEDFVWRRTRLGLKLNKAQIRKIDKFIVNAKQKSQV